MAIGKKIAIRDVADADFLTYVDADADHKIFLEKLYMGAEIK